MLKLIVYGVGYVTFFLGDKEIRNNDFPFLSFIYLKSKNEGAPRVNQPFSSSYTKSLPCVEKMHTCLLLSQSYNHSHTYGVCYASLLM